MIYLREWQEEAQRPEHRKQTEEAGKVLLAGLRLEYGWQSLPQIKRAEHGKPYFASADGVFFNYSHCRAGILCGISRRPIGVDIETVRSFRPGFAERVCSAAEQRRLEQADEKDRALLLTRLWTCKEAYLKYTGEGVRADLRALDLSDICFLGETRRGVCRFLLLTLVGACLCVCAEEAFTEADLRKI